jgi:elongation factor P
MKTAMQSRVGTVIKIGNDLMLVLKFEINRGGRGATNIKLRMKNLLQGNSVDRVFDSEDKMEDITLERVKFEYLYESAGTYAFMNQENFEQVELQVDDIGDAINYLTEGLIVDIQSYEGRFIGVILPQRVTLQVIEADPAVAGNTADGKVDKMVKLQTGLELRVPGFINNGDLLVINTETGEYQERAK